jgi:hypothetical protein
LTVSQPRHHLVEFAFVQIFKIIQINLSQRRTVASGDARHGLKGELSIVRRLPTVPHVLRVEAQLLADVIHKLIRAAQGARQVITNLDNVMADRVIIVQCVEPYDRAHVRRLDANQFRHLADRIVGAVAVLFLRDVEQRQNRRTLVGVFGKRGPIS